ncbi:putative uncharacterized protein PQLC2L [Nothoprocta perdicaria]|uniref:putative uncharacterized protein PQLC2L n=1 Tax=Nothoprocta perdicaria TaxID=30464 RepID=UPI000E1BA8B5|nr:putative uncharacterized protein PQLC2L [Nothoprocta perdicaria]
MNQVHGDLERAKRRQGWRQAWRPDYCTDLRPPVRAETSLETSHHLRGTEMGWKWRFGGENDASPPQKGGRFPPEGAAAPPLRRPQARRGPGLDAPSPPGASFFTCSPPFLPVFYPHFFNPLSDRGPGELEDAVTGGCWWQFGCGDLEKLRFIYEVGSNCETEHPSRCRGLLTEDIECRQIYVTCRNGRVDQALSLGFLLGWLAGDLTDLTGCYLTNQLPIQIVSAIFYVNMDIIMISQFDYYKLKNQKMPRYSTTLKNFCISWSLVCVTLHVILPCWLLLRNQDQSIGLEARNVTLQFVRYRQQSRGRGGAGALGTNPCSRVGEPGGPRCHPSVFVDYFNKQLSLLFLTGQSYSFCYLFCYYLFIVDMKIIDFMFTIYTLYTRDYQTCLGSD